MSTSAAEIPSEGPTVYVDEQIGSDETGDGSIQKPYRSAAQALVNHGSSPTPSILIRKSETEEYAAIAPTTLKKARKGAEVIEKKKQKAIEAEKKALEKAAELERSKSTVLEEDTSLPPAIKVIPLIIVNQCTKLSHRQRSSI